MNQQNGEYDGHRFPKGSFFHANIGCILRDPQMYDSPSVFNPDRFLDETTPEPTAVFGYGRRYVLMIFTWTTSQTRPLQGLSWEGARGSCQLLHTLECPVGIPYRRHSGGKKTQARGDEICRCSYCVRSRPRWPQPHVTHTLADLRSLLSVRSCQERVFPYCRLVRCCVPFQKLVLVVYSQEVRIEAWIPDIVVQSLKQVEVIRRGLNQMNSY
jgi:hypothetical protein